MEYQGKQLEFINFIKRDGTGTVMVGSEWNKNKDYPKVDNMSYLDDDFFDVKCLSLSNKTFIASGLTHL